MSEELRNSIHRWLDPSDSSSNYTRHITERQPNSGRWFTSGRAFDKWKEADNDFSFLWLNGGSALHISIFPSIVFIIITNTSYTVGMGKSVLW